MNVLLTGANGFVGSHILDELLRAGHRVTALLRASSNTQFIRRRMAQVRTAYGLLEDGRSIREALRGVDVVIHCAGKTKAIRRREYYIVNVDGTRNLVDACNDFADSLSQLILVSSLAVSGPATADSPVREDSRPRPVSHYGRSKWLAERCVIRHSRVPHTILRPAAVYGPRDRDFLLAFRAVRRGFVPLVNGGRQGLSLIYAPDVAAGVVACVGCRAAMGGTFHLAHPTPCTQQGLAEQIGEAMGRPAAQVFVPAFALYPVCRVSHLASAIAGRPSVLNLDKIADYRASGWVCDTRRAAEVLGFVAPTPLDEGVRRALDWYEKEGWLSVPGRGPARR